jgi:hypothetical protein
MVPKAQQKSTTSSGVMVRPTIPLTPEMLSFKGFMVFEHINFSTQGALIQIPGGKRTADRGVPWAALAETQFDLPGF